MRRRLLATVLALPPLVLSALVRAQSSADAGVPEPGGYRMEEYKAPTPATLSGARVLTTAEAQALWQDRAAAFIDVLPQPPRPEGLPAGTLWRPQQRRDIPGSVWLPDTGYGALAPPMQDYLARNLATAAGTGRERLLVFYCRPNCWHSWNAAKRARTLGYRVAWYPGGTEAWAQAGLPLEESAPLPRPVLTE
jgi:PQQ-dependent catabolism-associated CXXCW motif protein